MPATAERFGLRLSPVDERTDPEKNGRAAAQYLRVLHGQFSDWPLVLAAYNAGEGRVARELARTSTHTFDAISDRLPAETRLYVPKVMATIAARENTDPFALPAPTPKPAPGPAGSTPAGAAGTAP
jgi:membrane-bound lytic murein transglycosylase D